MEELRQAALRVAHRCRLADDAQLAAVMQPVRSRVARLRARALAAAAGGHASLSRRRLRKDSTPERAATSCAVRCARRHAAASAGAGLPRRRQILRACGVRAARNTDLFCLP